MHFISSGEVAWMTFSLPLKNYLSLNKHSTIHRFSISVAEPFVSEPPQRGKQTSDQDLETVKKLN